MIQLRRLKRQPADQQALQTVFVGAPRYAQIATGRPPAPGEAEKLLTELPPGKGYADKFVLGIYRSDELLGCIDVVRGYPREQTAFLGLFLLREDYQGRGWGRAAFLELESFVYERWPEIDTLRLGVLATNAKVIPFWKKMGFEATGEVKPYRDGIVDSEVLLMEKIRRPVTGKGG